mgnify:CR=1 FL=1
MRLLSICQNIHHQIDSIQWLKMSHSPLDISMVQNLFGWISMLQMSLVFLGSFGWKCVSLSLFLTLKIESPKSGIIFTLSLSDFDFKIWHSILSHTSSSSPSSSHHTSSSFHQAFSLYKFALLWWFPDYSPGGDFYYLPQSLPPLSLHSSKVEAILPVVFFFFFFGEESRVFIWVLDFDMIINLCLLSLSHSFFPLFYLGLFFYFYF